MNCPTTNNGFRQARKNRESEFPPTEEYKRTPPTRDIPIRGYKSVTHLTAQEICQRVEDFKGKCVSPHSHFLSQVVLLGSDMRIHRAFEYA